MNDNKLNLYFNKKYQSDSGKCELLLCPFMGLSAVNLDDPDHSRFDEYISNGKNYFNIVDNIEDCDLAVWPQDLRFNKDKLREFLEEVNLHHKSGIFFFNNDSDEKIDIGNNYLFRTSFYNSSKGKREFAIPGFSEDFVKNYFAGELPVLKKESKPIVGYCGYAAKSLSLLRIRKLLLKIKNVPAGPDGWLIRSKAIKNAGKNSSIIPNFIIRDSFWGGVYQSGYELDYQNIKKIRREFIDNIVSSNYIICTRGQGNFSYRLYETLSLGRIPVFINTDCVLPYEDYIKWREICVWVEAGDINKISQKIIDFHDSLSADDFINLQKRCRATWEEWLSPDGFFKNFYRHFDA